MESEKKELRRFAVVSLSSFLMELIFEECSEMYWFTRQGGESEISGVDDRQNFLETMKVRGHSSFQPSFDVPFLILNSSIQALDLLGFDHEKQRDIFRILKGILLLGNIEFKGDGEISSISVLCYSYDAILD